MALHCRFVTAPLFPVIVVGRIALDDIYHAKKVTSKPVAHIWKKAQIKSSNLSYCSTSRRHLSIRISFVCWFFTAENDAITIQLSREMGQTTVGLVLHYFSKEST